MTAGKGTIGFTERKGKASQTSAPGRIHTAEFDIEEFVGGREAQAGAIAVIEFVQQSAHFLKKMRESAGVTPREMAKELGVSVSRISQLESGVLRHAPSLRTAALYAAACGETLRLVAAERDDLRYSLVADARTAGPGASADKK